MNFRQKSSSSDIQYPAAQFSILMDYKSSNFKHNYESLDLAKYLPSINFEHLANKSILSISMQYPSKTHSETPYKELESSFKHF